MASLPFPNVATSSSSSNNEPEVQADNNNINDLLHDVTLKLFSQQDNGGRFGSLNNDRSSNKVDVNSCNNQLRWSPSLEKSARQNVDYLHTYEQFMQQRERHCDSIERALIYFNLKLSWPCIEQTNHAKEYILLCLSSSYVTNLPSNLSEKNWHKKVPAELREDLLLARIKRPEFAKEYRKLRGKDSLPLVLPKEALGNKAVVLALLKAYPEGLFPSRYKLAKQLLTDIDIMTAAARYTSYRGIQFQTSFKMLRWPRLYYRILVTRLVLTWLML